MIGSRVRVLRAGGRHLSSVLTGSKTVEVNKQFSNNSLPIRSKTTRPHNPGMMSSPAIMSELPYPMLEKLGLLNKDHIRIKDPANVEKLILSIVNAGFSKMQLVVDFDFTLTRVHINNKRCHCSWGIMDNSSSMPAFYREEANALLAKYYPIEIDPHMTEEEKIPHMIEWYRQIHKLLVKCKVTRDSLAGMVDSSNARLRIGTESLFKKLYDVNVPVLIFSAGMGDILEQVLRHFDVYTDNVNVVSNFFEYNDEGVMVGFKGALIHVFNKNENAIHSSNYFDEIRGRRNVILMGDSMGDIKMAVGVQQPNNVLKIGFLNDKVEERINTYMEGFDIVLIDDQSMDIANAIVKLME